MGRGAKVFLLDQCLIDNTLRSPLLYVWMSICTMPLALAQPKTIGQDGVFLTYDSATFSKVEVVEVKKQALPKPQDQLNLHPAKLLFLFYAGSLYQGSIELFALEDGSENNFKTAYPELLPNTSTLTQLLTERPVLPLRYPSGNPKEIPTIQNQMAGQYFLSHAQYLDFSWGSGVGFLVQYSQDASEYAVGSRLRYELEGITVDKRIGVSAYFNVGHPDLGPIKKDAIATDQNGEPIGE